MNKYLHRRLGWAGICQRKGELMKFEVFSLPWALFVQFEIICLEADVPPKPEYTVYGFF